MSTIWGSKWARSPRQDRRVVENGKFVELGQVQHPTPEPEPQEESALEIVHETEPVHETVNVPEIVNTEFAGSLPAAAEETVVAEIIESQSVNETLQTELEPLPEYGPADAQADDIRASANEFDGLGLNDIGGGMTLRETDKS